jgi:hypothetical protein
MPLARLCGVGHATRSAVRRIGDGVVECGSNFQTRTSCSERSLKASISHAAMKLKRIEPSFDVFFNDRSLNRQH